MTSPASDSLPARWPAWRVMALVFAVYLALALVQVWPLPLRLTTELAGGNGDPALVTMILRWNATHVPLSTEWWNALHYYPTPDVAAFTENLLGLGPLFAPVYWLTGNMIVAYNVTFIAMWPLAGFSAYLLGRFLTRRDDAAFLAGLAFGFSPFNSTGLGNLQTIATFGMPLYLLGLHAYLEERRQRWLWLFGAAWMFQSLANGYYMLFGALLIAGWMIWFCAARGRWRDGAVILLAWFVASVPLIPVLNTYRVVHGRLGLERPLSEIVAYSATLRSWAEVNTDVWLWSLVFPQGNANLFPGVTALAVVIAAVVGRMRQCQPPPSGMTRRQRRLAGVLAGVAVVSFIALLGGLLHGPWRLEVHGMTVVSMRSLDRPVLLFLLSGATLLWLWPRFRTLRFSGPAVFYTLMIPVIGVLCFGPVLKSGDAWMLHGMPYRWLMVLPGYDGLRAVPRIWMIAVLCLSTGTALGFAFLVGRQSRVRYAVFAVTTAGLLADGLLRHMPIGPPSESWGVAEAADRDEPILELPAGPGLDYFATYRTALHGRRLFNGVSGFNPPHYEAMLYGLAEREPGMLAALSSISAFDAVVDRENDPDGAIVRYVANWPGSRLVVDDGKRAAYWIPRGPGEPEMGPVLPVVSVKAMPAPDAASLVVDGRLDTGWYYHPQRPDQWIRLDLGEVRDVAGVTHMIGDYLLDFPRKLVVEVSTDGEHWERAWEGSMAAATMLGYIRAPREGSARLAFMPQRARYVRLRQLGEHSNAWRASELLVHGPRR